MQASNVIKLSHQNYRTDDILHSTCIFPDAGARYGPC